jgi:hypothetical protein
MALGFLAAALEAVQVLQCLLLAAHHALPHGQEGQVISVCTTHHTAAAQH